MVACCIVSCFSLFSAPSCFPFVHLNPFRISEKTLGFGSPAQWVFPVHTFCQEDLNAHYHLPEQATTTQASMLLFSSSRSIGLQLRSLEQMNRSSQPVQIRFLPISREPFHVTRIARSNNLASQALPRWQGPWPAQRAFHSSIKIARTHKDGQGIPPHFVPESPTLTGTWQRASRVQDEPDESPFLVPMREARKPYIPRALFFFLATALGSYGLAAWYSVHDTRRVAAEVRQADGVFGDFSSFITGEKMADSAAGRVSEARLRAAKKHKLADRLGRGLDKTLRACDALYLPGSVKSFVAESYIWVAQSYLDRPETNRVVWPVIGVNVLIFSAFLAGSFGSQGPAGPTRLFRFMLRNFMHHPAANRVRTMTTSVFSHMGLAHFGLNTFALFSFGAMGLAAPAVLHNFEGWQFHTAEASLFPSFLAFFVTAGAGASLADHLWTRLMWTAAKVRKGAYYATMFHGRIGSLGSSGAIYGLITLFALAYPKDGYIGLIFLPSVKTTPDEALRYLLTFDLAGLLVLSRLIPGWNIGHAAHLGGAFMGWIYFHYGNEYWEWWKRLIVQGWTPEMMYHWTNASKYSAIKSRGRDSVAKTAIQAPNGASVTSAESTANRLV